MAKTGARRGDEAIVAFDQISHQGEADPETSASALEKWIRLYEQIKHVWQDFRGDADTGIANADDSLIPRFAHSGGGAGSFTISTRKGPD